ncbi:MAG: paaZ 3 [Rhizobacter sp.]|nr:paaZ 3 [Rhizobacter sp.]
MGWYYEDFEVGRRVRSPGRTITEADIGAFAGLTGDFNPLHTDEVFARGTDFGGRIAHGPMVLGMAFGLGARAGLFDETVLGLLGVQWTFQAAVRPGDTLHADIEVLDARTTRRDDRGIVGLRLTMLNQDGATVQIGECQILFKRRMA